jgi:hypothetical protein
VEAEELVPPLPDHRPATYWVHYTTSCIAQSNAPEDGQNNCPKHVELTGTISKQLLLHLVGCLLYYLYQWCTVKQISNIEFILCILRGLRKTSVGWDIVVDIAIRYEVDGPGIESRWRWDFQHPSKSAMGATQPPGGTGSFRRVKRTVRGVDYPPPSSAEVKDRVELYLCSTIGPAWPVLGWTLSYSCQAMSSVNVWTSHGNAYRVKDLEILIQHKELRCN